MGNDQTRKHRIGTKYKNDRRNYTVMLVGRTGAGKSSLGNFLTTHDTFITDDCMAPITMKAEMDTKLLAGGKILNVIDTPGFGDSRSIEEIRKDLADAFYKARDGVDAFLFVISAAERVGADLIKNFEIFQNFIEHENFYEYVIPVFTKVDERLSKAKKKDIYKTEDQRVIIEGDLKHANLEHLKSGIIGKAKNDFMCISSSNTDKKYQELMTLRLCQTIESTRDRMGGRVCSNQIMKKAKDLEDGEKNKNPDSEDDEIREMVLSLLILILINRMTGEEIEELFGGKEKSDESRNLDTNASGRSNTCDKSTNGAEGRKEDLVPKNEVVNEDNFSTDVPYPSVSTTNTSARSWNKAEGIKSSTRKVDFERELQPINPTKKTIIN